MSRTFMEIMSDLEEIIRELDEKIFNEVVAKPKVSEWIPVTERLPEPYTDVLACWRDIRKGCEDDYCLITSWIEHGRWNSIADFLDMQVIAWMPLPEPYREQTERSSEWQNVHCITF